MGVIGHLNIWVFGTGYQGYNRVTQFSNACHGVNARHFGTIYRGFARSTVTCGGHFTLPGNVVNFPSYGFRDTLYHKCNVWGQGTIGNIVISGVFTHGTVVATWGGLVYGLLFGVAWVCFSINFKAGGHFLIFNNKGKGGCGVAFLGTTRVIEMGPRNVSGGIFLFWVIFGWFGPSIATSSWCPFRSGRLLGGGWIPCVGGVQRLDLYIALVGGGWWEGGGGWYINFSSLWVGHTYNAPVLFFVV